MITFTSEELVNRIQKADTLNELKRLVGPSDSAREAHEARERVLNKLSKRNFPKYGCFYESWPSPDREEFQNLMIEKAIYNAEYAGS